MRIEHLNQEGLDELLRNYLYLTEEAAVSVLHLSRSDARRALKDLTHRFHNATQDEIRWLLHNDPIVLACDVTGKRWDELNKDLILEFNKKQPHFQALLSQLP